MARSVFQRLGLPSPSSISKCTLPGWRVLERPSAVGVALRFHQLDRLGDPLVRLDAGAAQVVEAAQDVVVPVGRVRERVNRASTTSPVESLRNMRRSRRYCSAARTRSVTAAEPPVARSYSRRPSRTLIVVSKEPRVEPFSCSQFQPPSAICSVSSRSTMPWTSSPNQAPMATTLPLMHGSTSPSKKRRLGS